MDSVFKQLTRGVKFNHSKFPNAAQRFSKKAATAVQKVNLRISPVPSEGGSEGTEPSSGEEDDDDDVGAAVTLLDGIKAAEKKPKKAKSDAAKRAQLRREAINRFRNCHRIHVGGTDVADPLDAWSGLKGRYGVPDALVEAIATRYPGGPTPIQMQALPVMLDKREMLACAPTGSGKTAAYLIPLIHLLREPRRTGIRAVIVAPTRELAQQIHREAMALASAMKLRAIVLDSTSKKTGKAHSAEKVRRYDLVVSTPNRLVYMLKEHEDLLRSVEWLVVDESDKLFEAGPKGFRDQLAVVYRACDKANVCRAMFSATLAVEVEEWCKLNLDNVVSVTIGARNTAIKAVDQKLVYVGTEKGKLLAFKQLVAEGIKPPVLVFVQTKDRAKALLEEMNKLDLHADVIHSGRSQLQRDNAVKFFRAGRVWVLLCTELMGRGIDFKGVNLVINYDFPPSTVSYIHRIGRTGRAGRSGQAITFFTDQDKTLLRSIATVVKDSGGDVPDYMLQLKKASRQEKRQLAKRAVEREDIVQESKYDKEKRIKKEQMIEASKRRKRKAEEESAKAVDDKQEKKRAKKSHKSKKKKDV